MPLSNPDGEVRELKTAELRRIGSIVILALSLRRKVGARGPRKSPTKERITIRRSRDVVERFCATGDGWQSRMDSALQDWLKRRKVAG